MTRLYLVNASSGEWEDYHTWVQAIFDDPKEAEAYKRWMEDADADLYASLDEDDKSFFYATNYRISSQPLNPEYGDDDDLD